jgi:hypothetical protein
MVACLGSYCLYNECEADGVDMAVTLHSTHRDPDDGGEWGIGAAERRGLARFAEAPIGHGAFEPLDRATVK